MDGTTVTTSTDGEPKPQKKQVCRFFMSKGECYTKAYMRSVTYMRRFPMYYACKGHDTNYMLQDVARETLARMPIPLGKMDRHLGQSRTAKPAMLRFHLISSRGDTKHRLLTILE